MTHEPLLELSSDEANSVSGGVIPAIFIIGAIAGMINASVATAGAINSTSSKPHSNKCPSGRKKVRGQCPYG